jgi:hypothetical protein
MVDEEKKMRQLGGEGLQGGAASLPTEQAQRTVWDVRYPSSLRGYGRVVVAAVNEMTALRLAQEVVDGNSAGRAAFGMDNGPPEITPANDSKKEDEDMCRRPPLERRGCGWDVMEIRAREALAILDRDVVLQPSLVSPSQLKALPDGTTVFLRPTWNDGFNAKYTEGGVQPAVLVPDRA